MIGVGPGPIPYNEPVLKRRRGDNYKAPELSESSKPPESPEVVPESPEFPKSTKVAPEEYPIMDGHGATPK